MNLKFLCVSALLGLASQIVMADQTKAVTDRLVIVYKDGVVRPNISVTPKQLNGNAVKALAAASTNVMPHDAKLDRRAVTSLHLGEAVTLAAAAELARKVAAADPRVKYAEPDPIVYPMQAKVTPNDPLFSSQWALGYDVKSNIGGADIASAWALAPKAIVTVAVIDTGTLNHADFTANELRGMNFITDKDQAGNGVGRSDDSTDFGDHCVSKDSASWHGLKVAGVIGAVAGNGLGITGAGAYHTKILTVRALGRCGSPMSDTADALTWAVGGNVPGFSVNPNPARVVNLSLGAGAVCPKYMQSAIDYALSKNVVVVASAGNAQGEVSSPANCVGVIAVGAHVQTGQLALYSNKGSNVALTAPGGGTCYGPREFCLEAPVTTLGNEGTRAAGADVFNQSFGGTSAAAPHVSAVVAMLLAKNPLLTPAEVRGILRASARPHPQNTFCATEKDMCGAGMLDAVAALAQITPPVLTLAAAKQFFEGSAPATITAKVVGGPAGGHGWKWTQLSGPPVVWSQDDSTPAQSVLRFTTPAAKTEAINFRVEVTSSTGQTVADAIKIIVNNAPLIVQPKNETIPEGLGYVTYIEISDPDLDRVTVTIVSGPPGLEASYNGVHWNSPVAGTYTVVLRASDGKMETEKTYQLVVTSAAAGGNTSSSGGGGVTWLWSVLLAVACVALRRKPKL